LSSKNSYAAAVLQQKKSSRASYSGKQAMTLMEAKRETHGAFECGYFYEGDTQ
jgi:hypothetical protein